MLCDNFNMAAMRDTLALAEAKAAASRNHQQRRPSKDHQQRRSSRDNSHRSRKNSNSSGGVGGEMYVPPKQVLQYIVR